MAVQISGNDITVPRDGTFSRNVSIAGTLTYEDVTNVDSIGLVTARNGIEVGASPGVAASISVDGNMIVSGISTFGGDVQVSDKIIHSGDTNTAIRFPAADTITAETGGSERTRIDSSGRLLLGTDTSRAAGGNTHKLFQIESTDASSGISLTRNSATSTPSIISFCKSRGTSNGSSTIVQDDDELGRIKFSGADGSDILSEGARIQSFVDGTPGSDDMPGRLTFSTTADGAVSPTERLRITSEGKQYIIGANSGGFHATTLPNGNTLNINTKTSNDGLSVIRYSGSYASYAVNIGRSKSDTLGTNSIVADGDDLGHITWYGADGSDFNQAAAISVQVDGSPSDGTDMPAALIFKTTAEGSGTPTERLRLNSVGSAVFANGIQIGVDEGSSSSGDLLIHRYSSTSIDDGTDFDVTITWPHSNTGAFMVECFSGHSHYRGSISYYKVVGMYGASSASTGGVDMTAVQETNTNSLSVSDTSNATQRGNGSDYSITITGRSGESNTGTSIDSHVHVYVHSRVTPTSVTIS